MYSIGEFAKKLGITIQTLRDWDKKDKLKPSHISSGGHRYYEYNSCIQLQNEWKKKPYK